MNKKAISKPTILIVVCTAVVTFLLTNILPSYLIPAHKLNYTKLRRVEKLIDNRFYGEVENITDSALTGMLLSLDDNYSDYYTAERFQKVVSMLEGSYEGIGIELYVDPSDNLLTVLAPYEDTPSDRAGILPKDKIIKIDQLDVSGSNFEDAVDYMRGKTDESKKSKHMVLSILRDGKTLEIGLERETIVINTVKGRLQDECLYVRMAGFDRITLEKFNEILASNTDYKGLIIDLRNNPGGLFDVSIKIADQLLGSGMIVYSETKDGKQTKYFSDDKAVLNKPIVVLLNQNSASASEVLAGALKDNKKCVIVGEKSFGKGIVQDIIPLNDGSAIKFTTAKYYTPSGVCIDKIGIEPDYVVELPEEVSSKAINKLTYSEDLQLQKAISVILNY